MSKFDSLWNWIQNNGNERFSLTFAEIEKIAGLPIDNPTEISKLICDVISK